MQKGIVAVIAVLGISCTACSAVTGIGDEVDAGAVDAAPVSTLEQAAVQPVESSAELEPRDGDRFDLDDLFHFGHVVFKAEILEVVEERHNTESGEVGDDLEAELRKGNRDSLKKYRILRVANRELISDKVGANHEMSEFLIADWNGMSLPEGGTSIDPDDDVIDSRIGVGHQGLVVALRLDHLGYRHHPWRAYLLSLAEDSRANDGGKVGPLSPWLWCDEAGEDEYDCDGERLSMHDIEAMIPAGQR